MVFITIIIALIVIVAVKENWEVFQIVFTLFSNNITTAKSFTYFFFVKERKYYAR